MGAPILFLGNFFSHRSVALFYLLSQCHLWVISAALPRLIQHIPSELSTKHPHENNGSTTQLYQDTSGVFCGSRKYNRGLGGRAGTHKVHFRDAPTKLCIRCSRTPRMDGSQPNTGMAPFRAIVSNLNRAETSPPPWGEGKGGNLIWAPPKKQFGSLLGPHRGLGPIPSPQNNSTVPMGQLGAMEHLIPALGDEELWERPLSTPLQNVAFDLVELALGTFTLVVCYKRLPMGAGERCGAWDWVKHSFESMIWPYFWSFMALFGNPLLGRCTPQQRIPQSCQNRSWTF